MPISKINFKFILYLPIILLFFPAFALHISFLGGIYLIFYLSLYPLIILFFLKDNQEFLKTIICFFKYTPLKYLGIALLLMVINSCILSLFGITNLYEIFRASFVRIILGILPILICFLYIIKKYIHYDVFTKIFIFLFWVNLFVGFISYIGSFFEIKFINKVFDFFANYRLLAFYLYGSDSQASNYFAFGLPRLDNLHQEPSGYACFLYIFLPFVYAFGTSKIKLYKNKFLNILIKKTLIPFTWISIILTLSPIYLFFSLLITLIYFFKDLFKLIKKYFIIIIFALLLIIFVFKTINLSETYLSRIINILTEIKSFDDFIFIEPSLATRIVSYFNQFCIFLKHPLTGVGLGNLPYALLGQFYNSSLPLTLELVSKMNISINTNTKLMFNSSFFYTTIAENGLIVMGFIVYFIYRLFYLIGKLIKKPCIVGYDKKLLLALRGSLCAICIISFYNYAFENYLTYILFAFIIVTLMELSKKNTIEKTNEGNII